MPHQPDIATFTGLARTHTMVPVYRRLVGDTLTPVSAFCKLRQSGPAFLFESVVGGERIGRYSFLGSNPIMTFEATRDQVRTTQGELTREVTHADPLRLLEEYLAAHRGPQLPGLPRFLGGAVGYAGYDTIRYVENLPNAPTDDRGLPDLSFAFYHLMVIFDHVEKTVIVLRNVATPKEAKLSAGDLQTMYTEACCDIDETVKRLRNVDDVLSFVDIDPGHVPAAGAPPESNCTQTEFEDAVRKAQQYILAGDIFQVVLSQRFRRKTTAKPFDIYRALRVVSPSPFMFFVDTGTVTLIGASPEIMCRVDHGVVTNRPLAGTRKRGKTEAEDVALAEELKADPKERAEHIMLVDLARNDVGRVAEIGSVVINDLLAVERYSHVMHLSSTVTGKLRSDLTPFDALRASLPAGTLSGAPKVRAMEIIDELEPHRRGPYGGAVGYIDYAGNMDTCIALRTMVLKDGVADVQAGAGIVADSVPGDEYQETVNKAKSLLTALAVAETQLS
ncbi:anthranilate synthase component I [soil metagenome]